MVCLLLYFLLGTSTKPLTAIVLQHSPTIRDYIFPKENFTDAIIPPISCLLSTRSSHLVTTPFEPPFLIRQRLPSDVIVREDLSDKMKHHLHTLLSGPKYSHKCTGGPSTTLRNYFGVLVSAATKTATVGGKHALQSEADVKQFGDSVARPVEELYNALTGEVIDTTPAEIYTTDGSVRSNRLVCLDNREGPISIIWEDKSIAVGYYYIEEILNLAPEGKLSFDGDINETKWQKAKAILAKVRSSQD
jgi:hypothetical protein